MTDRGKNAMDEIRQVMTEMDNEENALLRQRDQETKAIVAVHQWLHRRGGLIAAVLAAIVGVVVQRSITGRYPHSWSLRAAWGAAI